jgi:hypothetical protein
VIIGVSLTYPVKSLSYKRASVASRTRIGKRVETNMAKAATGSGTVRTGDGNRLLVERGLREEKGRRPARSVTVNLAESPLGWLKARGLIDARQFEAGERLRADWTVAGLSPRVTMRWDAAPGGRRQGGEAPDPTLARIEAKRRTDAALAAAGPGLSDVLWRIVCAGEGMETAERALGWPARAGRVMLTLALGRLADHYRMA